MTDNQVKIRLIILSPILILAMIAGFICGAFCVMQRKLFKVKKAKDDD